MGTLTLAWPRGDRGERAHGARQGPLSGLGQVAPTTRLTAGTAYTVSAQYGAAPWQRSSVTRTSTSPSIPTRSTAVFESATRTRTTSLLQSIAPASSAGPPSRFEAR